MRSGELEVAVKPLRELLKSHPDLSRTIKGQIIATAKSCVQYHIQGMENRQLREFMHKEMCFEGDICKLRKLARRRLQGLKNEPPRDWPRWSDT